MDPLNVRDKVQSLFRDFLQSLRVNRVLVLRIPCSHLAHNAMDIDGGNQATATKLCRLMDSRTTKKYVQIFAVAVLVQELIIKSKSISQRDVYYTLKYLFKNQIESNIVIQELGALLNLRRHEMNIIPISKGRINGKIKFRFNNDIDWCDCDRQMISERISHLWISCEASNIHTIINGDVKAIIIIEKEGIFRRLCEDNFTTNKLSSILVTGCGFPDIATRAMVSVLAGKYPLIPIYGVCDYNPYGVALLSTFMFPSRNNELDTIGLGVKLRWLMLRNRHINEYELVYGDSQNELAVLMPLSQHDIRMIRSLQANPQVPGSFKEELSLMQARGQKMELESLFSFGLHVVGNAIQNFIEVNDYI